MFNDQYTVTVKVTVITKIFSYFLINFYSILKINYSIRNYSIISNDRIFNANLTSLVEIII